MFTSFQGPDDDYMDEANRSQARFIYLSSDLQVVHYSVGLYGTSNKYVVPSLLNVSSSKNIVQQNFIKIIRKWELNTKISEKKAIQAYGSCHMLQNGLFKENKIKLDSDKVFCALWLSDQAIVMGTKCNKLLVYNVVSKKLFHIPCLNSRKYSYESENNYGIHSVAMNPSKTLLATGGQKSNDVAVYTLPHFEPLCVGILAHKDFIFDIKWLDDEFFVSGARDGKIALWQVPKRRQYLGDKNINYHHITPVKIKCSGTDKIRALHFNPPHELTAVSLNGYIHSWDMRIFKGIFSQQLPYAEENVCLSYSDKYKCFAVGSSTHISLLEASKFKHIVSVNFNNETLRTRSVNFRDNMLTVGTGFGKMYFYDIIGNDLIRKNNMAVFLNAYGGIMNTESSHIVNECTPAIYTHCFDSSGTRLLTAGGPLPMEFQGYYAALWE